MRQITIIVGLLSLTLATACGGGGGGGSDDTVTITGMVGEQASIEALRKGVVSNPRKAQLEVTEGETKIFNESGTKVETCNIDSDGSYSCEVPADDVKNQPVFIQADYTATNEDDDEVTGTFTKHTVIPDDVSDGDSFEKDVTETTSVVAAAMMSACDHVGEECGPGIDSRDATEVINVEAMEAILESMVTGYADVITEETIDVDTAGMGFAATVEAAGNLAAQADGADIAEVVHDYLAEDSSAADELDDAGTVGGGIDMTTLPTYVSEGIGLVVDSYGDSTNDEAVDTWNNCQDNEECRDNPIVLGGLIFDMAPTDFAEIADPEVFIIYAGAIINSADGENLKVSDFTNPEIRQAAGQQILMGGAVDAQQAGVQVATLTATFPARTVDGTFDDTLMGAYNGVVAGRAAFVIAAETAAGLAAGQTITPEQAVTSLQVYLMNPTYQQNFAANGTLAAQNLIDAFVANPGESFLPTAITIPSGANESCASSTSCVGGFSCTAQSSGVSVCIPPDSNMNRSCGSDPTVCGSNAVCAGVGSAAHCMAPAGAPTGSLVTTSATTGPQVLGDDYTPPTTGGGTTCSGTTCTGGSCSNGMCVATGTLLPAGGTCTTATATQCDSGSCSSGNCASTTTSTSGADTGSGIGTFGTVANGGTCIMSTECVPGYYCDFAQTPHICQTITATGTTAGTTGTTTGTTDTTGTTTPAATSYTLTVTKTGNGTVLSSPAGIMCGATCTFSTSGSLTLTATADSGYTFGGWSGGCTGASATCSVTVSAATNVTATFTANTLPLISSSALGWSQTCTPGGLTSGNMMVFTAGSGNTTSIATYTSGTTTISMQSSNMTATTGTTGTGTCTATSSMMGSTCSTCSYNYSSSSVSLLTYTCIMGAATCTMSVTN